MFNTKITRGWLVGLLAAVGALSIIVHGGGYLLRKFAPDRTGGSIHGEIPSPDGQFKAVLFTTNGGGGISPYCYDSISVVPNGVNAVESSESERVYLAGCHTFVDPVTNNHTNGPNVKWLANNRLQVRFSANQGARGVEQLILKGFAADGRVFMAYVVSESGL
jgi:hypothetical protein